MDMNRIAIENSATSTGKEGCPCINETASLASLTERSCKITTDSGQEEFGVLLTAEGPCVPYSYGSSACLQHDALYDARCKDTASGDCLQYWCYVDAPKCRRSSTERVYRSDYFSRNDGVNVVS